MKKVRVFLLKNRVRTLFRRILQRHRSPAKYFRLDPPPKFEFKPIAKLFSWGNHLKTKAKAICWKSSGQCYLPMGENPFQEKSTAVPKGQMAVYVGKKDGEFRRVLVPVIYFNHPLFGQLLREAEEEFGYNHPGGITIPCRISEFENVKTRIAAGNCGRKVLTWK